MLVVAGSRQAARRGGRRRLPGGHPAAARPQDLRPDLVLKRGKPIVDVPAMPVPDWERQTVRVKRVTASDFAVSSGGATIRVIGLIEDQVVPESLAREPVVVNRLASPTRTPGSPRS